MIISLIVGGAVALTVGGGLIADKVNKKYDQSELEKTDENTLQQFDEEAFSEEQKAEFEESADMSVSDYQKIIAQMQEKIKSKKSEFNASKEGRGLLGTIGDGVKSLFGGGSKKVKNGIEDAEAKLNELIAKGENVTLSEIEEVYKVVMGVDLDLAAVQATLDSTDGSYTVQQMNPDGSVSEVTYSKEDIVAKVQENAQRLQEKFNKTKSDQGIISKALGGVNNLLGIGTTGNEAQAKISAFIELAGTLSPSDDDATFAAKFKSITGQELTEQAISTLMFDVDAYLAEYEANSTVELTDFEKEQIKDYYTMMGNSSANEAIMDYESTQDSVKQGFNTIMTTAIVVAAVAAAPFTGGASAIAVAGFGAAVGAATNVTLNATDGLTSADGYSLSEAGMDALKGGVTGALAGAGGAVAGKAAGATGKLAATKIGGKIVAKVGENAVTGAITGAAYGAASSAANYTIDTAVKNKLVDGNVIENMGQEYIDEQGRSCIQYPVIDDNGDILYYETHVYDSSGQFVEKFTSNDFSIGGLVSNTATGAVTGAVAGGVAGKAGFKFGKTDGSVGSRLAAGTKMGTLGGATGGAAGGAANWVQSGFEGGASGLVDNVVDGTLEGTATGATAGFMVSAGQILGEQASPMVLKHIEGKYENAQARKLAADNNARKAAEAADADGPDSPTAKAHDKAQKRAQDRVDKYDDLYKNQKAKVESYGFDDEAQAVAEKRAEFDSNLEAGKVDPLETKYDKARFTGDKLAENAKVKGAELGEKAKAKSAEVVKNAKAAHEARKANAADKKPIGQRMKDSFDTARASSKEAWNTIKNEKGMWNKFKAAYNMGKNAFTGTASKIISKFTGAGTKVANTEVVSDVSSEPVSSTPTGRTASSSTSSSDVIYLGGSTVPDSNPNVIYLGESTASTAASMADDVATNATTNNSLASIDASPDTVNTNSSALLPQQTTTHSVTATKSLARISGYSQQLANKLAVANVSETALMNIERVLRTNSATSITMIDVDTLTGAISFKLGQAHCEISGDRVIIDGLLTSADDLWTRSSNNY